MTGDKQYDIKHPTLPCSVIQQNNTQIPSDGPHHLNALSAPPQFSPIRNVHNYVEVNHRLLFVQYWQTQSHEVPATNQSWPAVLMTSIIRFNDYVRPPANKQVCAIPSHSIMPHCCHRKMVKSFHPNTTKTCIDRLLWKSANFTSSIGLKNRS